jgi:rhodanese-related sulfurtransferase
MSVLMGIISLPAGATDGVIAADEAYAAAKRGELIIIDVRTSAEWQQTGIPDGAKTADVTTPDGLEAFVAAVARAVAGDREARIAVICRSGNRSTKAQAALRNSGFTNVLNIKEGMAGSAAGPGWLGRGLPVSVCRNC